LGNYLDFIIKRKQW